MSELRTNRLVPSIQKGERVTDSNSQSQTFTCPKCGAPQDYQGGSAPTIQCPYCETTLIVPEALRTPAPNFAAFGAADWSKQAGVLAEIKRLVAAGNKIAAIKLYRETFGVGLKQAKDAVEAIEHGQNVQMAQISIGTPQSFQVTQGDSGYRISTTPTGGINISRTGNRSGCASAFVVFIVIVVIASIVIPILLSVGAFAFLLPASSNSTAVDSITDSFLGTPIARASATLRPTAPPPTPTPQFANVVNEFGGKGTGAGKMQDARAIAVDNHGNIFVAEYLGGRVQTFDKTGKFKTQCLIDTKLPVSSMAADRRGNLFVLQGVTLTQYDAATCEPRNSFAPKGGSNYKSLAVGADGILYGTMTGNNKDSVIRFNADETINVIVDSAISGQLDNFELDPVLAVDGDVNFYVLGTFARQIFKFSHGGKFLDSWGAPGNEPGQFSAPNTLAVDSQGRVYVSDNKGIQVFSNDGRYLDVFKIPQSVASGMAFDDDDNLWVAARERVYQFKLAEKN